MNHPNQVFLENDVIPSEEHISNDWFSFRCKNYQRLGEGNCWEENDWRDHKKSLFVES